MKIETESQPEFNNTNHGVLFPNLKPFTTKSPHYTGTFNVNGQDIRIVGWNRKSRKGDPFISLTIHIPQAEPQSKAAA